MRHTTLKAACECDQQLLEIYSGYVVLATDPSHILNSLACEQRMATDALASVEGFRAMVLLTYTNIDYKEGVCFAPAPRRFPFV